MVLVNDLTGKRFGLWTILRRDGSMPYGGAAWIGLCDCGNEGRISGGSLSKGDSQGCGCVSRKKIVERSTTHGLTRHPLYAAWARMKARCYYTKHVYYSYYGGRGITVCDRWQNFEPFYEDNLLLWKQGLTLDREDNDLGYSPANCRWITQADQNRNRSNTIWLTLADETMRLNDWAARLGLPPNTLYLRRENGWSDDDILRTPHGQRRLSKRGPAS